MTSFLSCSAIPPVEGQRTSGFQKVGRHIVPVVSVVLLGLLAYSNSFHSEFVFDDVPSIVDNPVIKNLGNYLLNWSGYRANPTRFIGYSTFALNYRLGLLDVTGYHVFNFCVHVLNALLIYALVILSLKTPHLKNSVLAHSSRHIAFVASALFVTHPIQTGAVTYIVQRLTSLATMFYLLTLVQYIRWRLRQNALRMTGVRSGVQYSLILLTSILAMYTKEIAFTLPIIIFLYEFFFLGAIGRKKLLSLAPIIATSLIIPLTLLNLHKPLGEALSDVSETTRVQTTISRLDYLKTEVVVIVKYLRLLVMPVDQNVDYDLPLRHSFIEPRVMFALILIFMMIALALYLHGKSSLKSTHRAFDPGTHLISFGIVWFFVTLLVESSLIPIVDVIFEHRVYLPSVGFFIATATAMFLLARRLSPAHPTWVIVGIAVPIALSLAAATALRNNVWADDLSLWTDAVRKSPNKSRPHTNLGFALMSRGRVDLAIDYYHAALRADPNNAEAHNNLGVAYSKTGKDDQAISHLRIVIALQPDHVKAHTNLGAALMTRGEVDPAIQHYLMALKIDPNYAKARNNLGVAYFKKGMIDEAIAQFRIAISLRPDYPEAHNNLGIAYGRKGWAQQATEEISLGMKLQSRGAR
jgi:protein O-mannosyl-transferase